jgi:hypothetical protein
MRRAGMTHEAKKVYEAGELTNDQLETLKSDPAFVVQEIDDSAVVVRDDDFDKAIADKVNEELSARAKVMQASFDKAVADAAAEKVKAAEDKAADLEKQLADLTAASAKK